jgi:anthranilate synthase component 1
MSTGFQIRPNFEAYCVLAKKLPVVPVVARFVADEITPVSAYNVLAGDAPGFLFESAEGGERWGRYSFLGRNPFGWISSKDEKLELLGEPLQELASTLGVDRPSGQGALAFCESLLAALTRSSGTQSLLETHVGDLGPFHGGLVGHLGYDVVREVERLGQPPMPANSQAEQVPDVMLALVSDLVVFDHWRQSLTLVANTISPREHSKGSLESSYDSAVARIFAMTKELSGSWADSTRNPSLWPLPFQREPHALLEKVSGSFQREEYLEAVRRAKEYIFAGDIFQVVLSQRFDFELEAHPFEVYRALRVLNPSSYLYYVHEPHAIIVGSSPEPLVRLRNGVVTSRPIAGSRPRGADEAEDQKLGEELAQDPKERAEHVMLVDLARNDVGKVSKFGSVRVEELMTIERYSHIMHLTSQVSGTLREGLGPLDVLRATLPAGTVSGAPKVRAMQIIDELEPVKRGPYAGVVGYLDLHGNMDMAIAIRTMIATRGEEGYHAFVQAGGGIVADSDPEREDAECHQKAAALLAAAKLASAWRSLGQRG